MRRVSPRLIERRRFFCQNGRSDLISGDFFLFFIGGRKEFDTVRPSELCGGARPRVSALLRLVILPRRMFVLTIIPKVEYTTR